MPTRRAIGDARKVTVAQARDAARRWHELIAKGVDPQAEQQRQRRQEQAKRADTFSAVAEEYIKVHLEGNRRAHRDEQEIRRLLLPAWADRPLTEITRRDVVQLVEDIAATGKQRTAHIAFGHARSIFSWAIRRDLYGLETSPCFLVRPADHAGQKRMRQRVLDDRELRALWNASDKVGYPHGRLAQLILLTGTRRTEAGEAQWSEFDLDAKQWTIPAARFKSNAVHRVPLSPQAVALLQSLPRNEGYVFTTTRGVRPIGDYSGAKAALDGEMADELGAPAAPWQLHDLRRTFRSRLSELKVPSEIAELAIGHAKKGLQRIYDQHEYADELADVFARWAVRLASIVSPDNVTPLDRRRRA
jgi:integrase